MISIFEVRFQLRHLAHDLPLAGLIEVGKAVLCGLSSINISEVRKMLANEAK